MKLSKKLIIGAIILIVALCVPVSWGQSGYTVSGGLALNKNGGDPGASLNFGVQKQITGAFYSREYVSSVNWGKGLDHIGIQPILYLPMDKIWTGLKLGLHGRIEASFANIDDFELGGGLELYKNVVSDAVGAFGSFDYHNIPDSDPPDYLEFQAGFLVSF